ncbi:hypothetical protein D3C73_1159280 [compost metagenome]
MVRQALLDELSQCVVLFRKEQAHRARFRERNRVLAVLDVHVRVNHKMEILHDHGGELNAADLSRLVDERHIEAAVLDGLAQHATKNLCQVHHDIRVAAPYFPDDLGRQA